MDNEKRKQKITVALANIEVIKNKGKKVGDKIFLKQSSINQIKVYEKAIKKHQGAMEKEFKAGEIDDK